MSIKVLEGLDAIRKRPQMYVGPLDNPLLPNLLLQETLCRALVSGCRGLTSKLEIIFDPDGLVSIETYGEPWPNHMEGPLRKAETILTTLYACRDLNEGEMPGACNTGIVTVNALSKLFLFVNYAPSEKAPGRVGVWRCMYERGHAKFHLTEWEESWRGTGTAIRFCLDPEIVPHREFQLDPLVEHLRSVRPSGLTIEIVDCRLPGPPPVVRID